ncbi:TPA: restriction endonuclease subunit S [Haemophilus influenzae]
MLNYSEVLEDNFTYRIDAEFFKKIYLEEEKIIARLGFEETKNIIVVKGGKRLPEGHDFLNDKSGIPYIRAEDIKNGFVDYTNSPTISLLTHREIKAYQTEYNDVLMTIVGNSIGDIGIVKFNLDICNLTENAVRLITKKIKPEYLFSFLGSKFGQNYIERNKVGTAQPKLSIERIRKIKIPIVSSEFQDEIESLVSSAFEKLQKSKETYQAAQNLLLEHLGLKDFNPPLQKVNIKSFSNSFGTSGRLDAEFYQEKYESYLKKIQVFNNGFVQIQQEYSQVKSKSKFDLPAYQYIEIGDVNVSDGSYSFNEVATEDLPANAKIMVKEGDILISTVRPNRGAITVIEHDRDDLIVSGAFTVLRRKVKSYFNNEFLKVLLRTEIYKDWLLQFNVGTSYPVIKDEDILNLVIPNVEETIQTQIADLIRQSNYLRIKSKGLLEKAKKAVELAIEKDQESALDFIKGKQTNDCNVH